MTRSKENQIYFVFYNNEIDIGALVKARHRNFGTIHMGVYLSIDQTSSVAELDIVGRYMHKKEEKKCWISRMRHIHLVYRSVRDLIDGKSHNLFTYI